MTQYKARVTMNQQKSETDSQGAIFISYAAVNYEFAARIRQALKDAGQAIWIDSEDIRYADNWKDAVLPAIERASAILFVVSQASTISENCLEELRYAEQLGKRIIPLILERAEKLPDSIRARVRRDFRDPMNFEREFLKLLKDITSDPEYVHLHTMVSFRAARWLHDKTGLLDTNELIEVDKWLAWAKGHTNLEPHPSGLILDFIQASRMAVRRRRRGIAWLAFGLPLIIVGVYLGVQWWLGIPRAGIDLQMKGDAVTQQRTADGVARLHAYLDSTLPDKSDKQRLLIATWNIREFGRRPRSDEALHYIAEIISHFDVVAIQEIQGGSTDYDRVREILGPNWLSLVSDISDGQGSSNERLGFLYDRRKVKSQGLIAELVLTGDLGENDQPVRSPYLAGFTFAGIDIVFCNVHILYGPDPEARVTEMENIALQLQDKIARGRDFPQNVILIGDMQADVPGLKEVLEDTGFVLPSGIRDLSDSSISTSSKPWDQIALAIEAPLVIEPNAMGVVDYYQFVYREDQETLYTTQVEGFPKTKYLNARTLLMSDHLPKWLSLTVSQ